MHDSALQEVICCIGQPVAGNPTQFMMQRAMAEAGLDWCCLTLEVGPDELGDAIRGIRAMGFRGAILTIPHKIAAIEQLDSLTETAQLIGAANCIRRVDNQLIGDNTDGRNFVQSLNDVCDCAGKRILVLGAGGTARAIAVELGLSGATHIGVANRTIDRAQQLVDLLNEKVAVTAELVPWEGPLQVPADTDILINATSIGVLDLDAQVPLDLNTLDPSLVVADVVFNPPATWLLFEAEQRGCKTLSGLGMLVNQAVMAFHTWTGHEPDSAVMREAVEEFLEV